MPRKQPAGSSHEYLLHPLVDLCHIRFPKTILHEISGGRGIWIGWHVITNKSESEELSRLARKRHGANDHKSNITDW